MARIVVDNASPAARQRQLEAQVQVAFAKVASGLLIFLAGRHTERSLIKAMREFIAIHESARAESTDPKGVAIRGPRLDRYNNGEDEQINAILRGSLRMVAAMLESNARFRSTIEVARSRPRRKSATMTRRLRRSLKGLP
jgi:hypothetical protein